MPIARGKIMLLLTLAACSVFLFADVSSSWAASFQYPYIYKSPRAMGMGGVGVAIGGKFDSVFYNPAGLGLMPEGNWEVNILGTSASVGENVKDFYDDLSDAFDTDDRDGDGDDEDDQLTEVNGVLDEYRGEHMHFDAADITSVANNFGRFSVGVAAVGTANVDAVTHQGLGSDGLLEVNAEAYYGGIVGMSTRIIEGLHTGASFKFLGKETVQHEFSVRDIVENQDDIGEYITDDLRENGDAVGVDLGVIYQLQTRSIVRPAIGLSVLNVGDTDFGDAGEVPMTANVGIAATAEVPVVKSLTVGIDYVDMFNNYEEDSDIGKRIMLGAEVQVFENPWFGMALRTGLYQGYATFGADLTFTLFKVTYATYAEEVGAYAGQDDDRRHVLAFNFGW